MATTIRSLYIRDKYCTHINVPGVYDSLNGQPDVPRFPKFKASYDFPEINEFIPKVIHYKNTNSII